MYEVPMTNLQAKMLNYLADLNDEFDTRDYSAYPANGDAIRAADIAFMNKVGVAFRSNRHVFDTTGS